MSTNRYYNDMFYKTISRRLCSYDAVNSDYKKLMLVYGSKFKDGKMCQQFLQEHKRDV